MPVISYMQDIEESPTIYRMKAVNAAESLIFQL